jgi:glycine hydroxymethyltransferase
VVLNEQDCLQVVDWIDEIIINHQNNDHLVAIRKEVNKFMEDFPLY